MSLHLSIRVLGSTHSALEELVLKSFEKNGWNDFQLYVYLFHLNWVTCQGIADWDFLKAGPPPIDLGKNLFS